MKRKMKTKKRGLSPIVTTVLLIALTIVVTSVVFIWFRGMVGEGTTKFGENIKLVCDDVDFEVEYYSGTLSIVNNGNVPMFRVDLKISEAGNYRTINIEESSAADYWPDTGLSQGSTFSGDISDDVEDAEGISIIPILIGTSSKGKKTFVCEGQYGQEIPL